MEDSKVEEVSCPEGANVKDTHELFLEVSSQVISLSTDTSAKKTE